ncbi:MAG: cytochrome c-type biogenesis protein CcmH [Anaerolineaceae bacterium]|nr:cytochrome c-type biogenesis protein CcmH [Anaerolineaceae bacterium]
MPYSLLPTPYSLLLILLALLLATIILASLPTPTLAQEPSLDEVNDVAKQMNCPTCVGVNLADCRTQTCEQWRAQIADLLAEGYTEQEVLDYFETRYGTRVLLEPPTHGLTLILWVLPVVALLAGGIWLGLTMRKWNQAKLVTASTTVEPGLNPPPISDAYLAQVEQDLDLK